MTDAALRPRRSVLYMPGSKERALEKGRGLDVDALIIDLEDAVSPDEKEAARETATAAISEGGYGKREIVLRVNGLDTPWGLDDLRAACAVAPDAVLIPKVSSAAVIHEIDKLMTRMNAPEHVNIWAMMETPLGVMHAEAIALSSPRLQAFVIGSNDLVKDLHAEHTADRAPIHTVLSLCLLAARAYELACIDGVYNAFKDEEGFRAECVQGRQMGFDGKTLIHPAQIDICNEVFSPSDEEIDQALKYVEAFEVAQKSGEGVAVVDGKIVENLHVENAKRILSIAAAIGQA